MQSVRHATASVAPGAENVNILCGRTQTWIEIKLIGMDDKPIPGQKFHVLLPTGESVEGSLDDEGRARLDHIEGGRCFVTFPDLDREAWEDKDAG